MGRKFILMVNVISGLLFLLSITGELQAQVDWCSIAQGDAQQTVTAGGPYKNHGQEVKTAAHAANPYLYDGRITEECHSCIVSQFARRIPIGEQESCGCAQDLCVVGGPPLDPTCDPCVAEVCDLYPYCCDTEWNVNCGAAAVYYCGIYCPEATCWATNCDNGQIAPAGCGCGEDCCTRGDCCPDAESFCDIFCEEECAHDLCVTGDPLDPACDTCVESVCDYDPYCCGYEGGWWDGICIQEAVDTCGISCPDATCWVDPINLCYGGNQAPAGCWCGGECCYFENCCSDMTTVCNIACGD